MHQQKNDSLADILSAPRLAAYHEFFKPASSPQLLGYYLWAQALSAAVHPLIGILEVVLRNAIHQSLSLQCSKEACRSYTWYDKATAGALSLRGKSLDKVNEFLFTTDRNGNALRNEPQPTPDKVVSELSFGFWPNIMESLNERYAAKTFLQVFSLHPHSKLRHWSFQENREPLVLRLKRLQSMRNRVCHFEAMWKLHWLDHEGKNYSHSLQGLRKLHQESIELLSWISPDAVALYKDSFAWDWFNKLCTNKAIRAFADNPTATGVLAPISDPAPPAPTAFAPMQTP